MPKKLTNEELDEVINWLQEQGVTYKNLNRDFSDVIPVANLLKVFYPKLVDLYNYPPRNNTQLKFNNWETFNYKVLSKLGLKQNKSMMGKLSQGTPGAIEALLFDIMLMIRSDQSKGDKLDEHEPIWNENEEIMMVTVNKKIGDAIVQVPQKMILFSIYEQVLRESQAKDNCMAIAKQKITHLENVLQLKAERIEELLCDQLSKISIRSQHDMVKSATNSGPNTFIETNDNEDSLPNAATAASYLYSHCIPKRVLVMSLQSFVQEPESQITESSNLIPTVPNYII